MLETRNLFVIETVDSEKLAAAINKQLEANKTTPFNETLQLPLNVFVQVKTSDEDSKSGIEPAETAGFVKLIKEKMPNLKVCGLMTIGKLNGDPSEDFACLRSTRSLVATSLEIPEEELELSMGMSGDFEQAARRHRAPSSTSLTLNSTFQIQVPCLLTLLLLNWESQIAQGSTSVRVGSSIFGARSYKAADAPAAQPSSSSS